MRGGTTSRDDAALRRLERGPAAVFSRATPRLFDESARPATQRARQADPIVRDQAAQAGDVEDLLAHPRSNSSPALASERGNQDFPYLLIGSLTERSDAAPHAVIYVILHPLPETVLA